MHKPDKEEITFMIERGTYCYKVMPFNLKNTRITYQRLVNMIFKKQIGVTMEVYIDDIMMKVSEVAVSSAHMREELGAKLPVFYTSKALLDAKTRYPKIEKLILVLVVAARKLKPYFQAHIAIVMTQYPLRLILNGSYAFQQIMKWALELGQYGIVY
ncbi:uncharacterized protein LOC126599068 [Malus sylvestris]|uniref:uncharacterized protein LOC126599068 n=1 Tax=Malus sylvestris TaxID=3752 RepID=UPI0021ABA8BC|nr:uncharacterized protein LOC126599068 [Malus sylvestris]